MSKKYNDRPLPEIAQDMLNWCLSRGCQQLGETNKEFRVQCPNMSCSSREKAGTHKAFDVNRETAQYHCWHCGLKGQGLDGPRGLIAQMESGDFIPSATISRINEPSNFFKQEIKPKEKVEPVMNREEVGKARAKGICKDAEAYLKKRGIPETVYRDFDYLIFSYPKGKQLSFMKQPLNDTAIFFTIRNDEGEVVHVHYKLLHGGYYMSPGTKPIYLTKATALPTIVIVEGIFDALSVYTAGYRGAALLGHEITSNHDLSVFENKIVVIMLDNDDAGKASVDSVASTLATVAYEVKIASIPYELGKDANDVLVKAGEDKLSELIEGAVMYNEYKDIEQSVGGPNGPPEIMEKEVSESDKADISPGDNVKLETNDNKPQVKVKTPEDKPKKENAGGIVFPQEAWRGIFETYRQAQTGTTEAPDQYHFGVFKTVAGIVVGRTAYVWSGGKLFANFYTVIIGPTTRSRKSTAASRGTSLLSDVDETGGVVGADPLVLILGDLSTPAGLIEALKGQNPDELEEATIEYNRAVSTSGCEGYRALIVIDEFASLLRQAQKEHGSGIIQTLTKAYDCKPRLQNITKGNPTTAKNAVVSMICLSTRDWLENTLDIADVYGGYVCRNLFYEWTRTAPIPDPDEPNQALLNKVTMKLQGIRRAYEERGKRQLKYQFSVEAKPILNDWYIERYDRDYPSEVIAAAVQRVDINVKKLALLYAVLENEAGDLTIHADQLQDAIAVGEYWEQTATRLFGKLGFTKEARNERRVMEAISDRPLTKRELSREVCSELSAKQLDSIIKSLISTERTRWITEKYTDAVGRQRTRKLLALNEDR